MNFLHSLGSIKKTDADCRLKSLSPYGDYMVEKRTQNQNFPEFS